MPVKDSVLISGFVDKEEDIAAIIHVAERFLGGATA